MISALVEAAVRSVLLALAVGAGLRTFRVRNVVAQKAAWGLVLAAAFLMPVLSRVAGKWPVLSSSSVVNSIPPRRCAIAISSSRKGS